MPFVFVCCVRTRKVADFVANLGYVLPCVDTGILIHCLYCLGHVIRLYVHLVCSVLTCMHYVVHRFACPVSKIRVSAEAVNVMPVMSCCTC